MAKGLGCAGLVYSPEFSGTILATSGLLIFSPLGGVRGIGDFVKTDLISSGALRESVRKSLGKSIESSSSVDYVEMMRKQIDEGAFMGSAFGSGLGGKALRAVTGVFLPGSAAMASRVAELLHDTVPSSTALNSTPKSALKPETVVATAVEGLVEGTVSDKTDTLTALALGVFSLVVGGTLAVDRFVLRNVGERVESTKERVGEGQIKVREGLEKAKRLGRGAFEKLGRTKEGNDPRATESLRRSKRDDEAPRE